MQNAVHYQRSPRLRWHTISQMCGGKQGASDTGAQNAIEDMKLTEYAYIQAMNAGIFRVKATNDTLGRVFVEKRFGQKEIRSRMAQREIRILHQVGDHPNITKMIDHFLDESACRSSVFLEYCDAGSMLDLVEKVAISPSRVNEHKIWAWFIQATEALLYCHRGPNPKHDSEAMKWDVVYHRDIKPANILLKRESNQIVAKLADFGCATSQSWTWLEKADADASRASIVTIGFDAPEFPTFNSATDIWQLALTMVCVCTGILAPYSRRCPKGQRWDKASPSGAAYSTELNDVLRWCLTDLGRRPNTAMVLEKLKEKYRSVKDRLPTDAQPLELLSRAQHASSGNARADRVLRPEAALMPLHRGVRIPRPAHAHRVLSEPAIDRHDINGFSHLLGGIRSPQGPFPPGHPLGRERNPMDAILEEMDNEDVGLRQAYDARVPGGFHSHPGFFPPFDPFGDFRRGG